MIMNIRNHMKNQKGFTLVELMVVIAILGILATIGMTKMSDATASANGVKIVADLRTIDAMINVVQASGGAVAAGAITYANNKDLYALFGGNDTDVPTPPKSGKYITKQQSINPLPTTGAYTIVADTTDTTIFKAAFNGKKLSELN